MNSCACLDVWWEAFSAKISTLVLNGRADRMQQQAGLREKRLQTPVWFSVQYYTDTGGLSAFYTTWRNISVLMQDFHFDENNCSFSSQCPCNGITDCSDKVLVWAVDFSQSQIHMNLNPAGAQNAVSTRWHANAPADCHAHTAFLFSESSSFCIAHSSHSN